jgi:hypothetical protein
LPKVLSAAPFIPLGLATSQLKQINPILKMKTMTKPFFFQKGPEVSIFLTPPKGRPPPARASPMRNAAGCTLVASFTQRGVSAYDYISNKISYRFTMPLLAVLVKQ